ncbi:hypothetical protein [Rubrobacter radiotolerans]|uniref:Uncharacterized protein n=1 Tax=Rubrobacter radiotolerans TaxID=42256 RepID=A0AB35T616_RUBRA|nr:hypothetical protein [Rubrobacter radiotolerans]MDX5895139.1 hypothetical protein [Rubrobacter radiotolerans]SMC07527.1 hypothetical protein SAMN00767673_2454 [Rubrobacter radiotolerans DSM 5868]
MKDDERTPVYEVEVASLEEFIRFLGERESSAVSRDSNDGVRSGVLIARLSEERTSRFGFPSVRRYVVASFIYGQDLVSYRRTTSSIVELPELVRGMEERQQGAYEQVRGDISRSLAERFPDVSIYEGNLRLLHIPERET